MPATASAFRLRPTVEAIIAEENGYRETWRQLCLAATRETSLAEIPELNPPSALHALYPNKIGQIQDVAGLHLSNWDKEEARRVVSLSAAQALVAVNGALAQATEQGTQSAKGPQRPTLVQRVLAGFGVTRPQRQKHFAWRKRAAPAETDVYAQITKTLDAEPMAKAYAALRDELADLPPAHVNLSVVLLDRFVEGWKDDMFAKSQKNGAILVMAK